MRKGSKKNVNVVERSTLLTPPSIETQGPSSSDLRPNTIPSDTERRLMMKHSAQSLLQRLPRSGTGHRPSPSRRDFLTKYDKKYLVFGEKTDEEPK